VTRTVHVQYFAALREQAGRGTETRETSAATARDLYAELRQCHGLALPESLLRVAINEEFCDWERPLVDGDRVVFIPPVAGG